MGDLISVVLPVYNGEKYLRESIDSILAQTYEKWELIIVDDCSKDSTPVIAKEYEKRDPRIRYYRNEHNLKLPRNLNRGFSISNGAFLTWTSDDNRFKPQAFEKMVDVLLDKPNVGFVFCDYELIDETGKVTQQYSIPSNFRDQIVGTNVVGACFMYTREVYNKVGDYQHGALYVEDYDYWQRVFAQFDVVAIHETLYQYRLHGGSLTGTLKIATVNAAFEKAIRCNRMLYPKLTWGQKYYYYNALYRCNKKRRNSEYFKYIFYKLLFDVRRGGRKIERLWRKR